jgi:hypothetical protein
MKRTSPDKTYSIPPDGKGFMITGQAKYYSTGKPASNAPLRLAIANGRKEIFYLCTDSSGFFRQEIKELKGKTLAIFQPVKTEGQEEVNIIPFPQYSDEYISFAFPVLAFSENQIDYLNELAKISFVEKNYTEKAGPEKQEEEPWVFYGNADEVVDMNNYIELPQMEEVFRELCRFVILSGSGRSLRIHVLDKYTNRIVGNNPLILADGIPMDSHLQVLSLKPSGIRRISVVAGKYFYRNAYFDGIIDIEFRKRNPGLYSGFVTKELEGYTDFPEKEPLEYSRLDRRIYWQPFLKGKNGVFEGVFKAGTIPGIYTICVEGRDRKGRSVYKEVYLKIR